MATGDSSHPGPGAEDAVTRQELTDDDTGRWQVTTETSIYLLDLDQRQVMRVPGAAADHGIDKTAPVTYYVASLRADRRFEPLAELILCRLDETMFLTTYPRPDQLTLRGSTRVREIRRLPAPPNTPGAEDR